MSQASLEISYKKVLDIASEYLVNNYVWIILINKIFALKRKEQLSLYV